MDLRPEGAAPLRVQGLLRRREPRRRADKGKVFVATFDGRLVALDAATGRRLWEKDTIVDRKFSYTITGAPRVYKGKVIIGNGGAEYGVRGYITAYDAETGAQKWRWFTVPGDPAQAATRTRPWPRRPDLGPERASTGRPAAAAPCGTRWRSTPS